MFELFMAIVIRKCVLYELPICDWNSLVVCNVWMRCNPPRPGLSLVFCLNIMLLYYLKVSLKDILVTQVKADVAQRPLDHVHYELDPDAAAARQINENGKVAFICWGLHDQSHA